MSRVVNTDSTGKARNQQMRLSAEIIRRLSQKTSIDDETRDMAATLVASFKSIEDGIEEAMVAWEKRNYWNKVEQFRAQWTWVGAAAARLERLILNDEWEQLPAELVKVFEHFAGITISKFTRGPEAWQGAYDRLLREARR
jgi:hypothetical protein